MIDTNKLIGLTEEAAVEQIKAAGMKARVRERNGEKFVVTMDVRRDRVNLFIAGDKVYKVAIG